MALRRLTAIVGVPVLETGVQRQYTGLDERQARRWTSRYRWVTRSAAGAPGKLAVPVSA